MTRAVVKLRQITQANEKGEKSDRMTASLLSGRGSSESGLQRYEEQLCGWRVSHSPALPSLEGEGQEHSPVTPKVHREMIKDESPGSALQQKLHFTKQRQHRREALHKEGDEWLGVGLKQVGSFPTKYSHSGPPGLSPCSTLLNCCRWLGLGQQAMPVTLDSVLSVPTLSHSHICLLEGPTGPFLPWSFFQELKGGQEVSRLWVGSVDTQHFNTAP